MVHNTSIAQFKINYRKSSKSKLAKFLAANDKSNLDKELAVRLKPLIKNLSPLALFWALPEEPDLWTQLGSPQVFAWPRMNEAGGLDFYSAKDPSQFAVGDFSVREPLAHPSTRVDLSEIKGVCIPGLSFDREGYRLGRGQGYYDRALKNFEGQKIGVGYSVQVSGDALPREPHDIRMDFIVTENERIEVKG